jgi:cell division septum initiation protein DivIVA
MSTGDDQGRERDVRERIVGLMQSIGKGPRKQLTAEEAEKFKNAASRLDQILNAAADVDQQVLKSAAARLDRLLSDIRAGKDVTRDLKRRGTGED